MARRYRCRLYCLTVITANLLSCGPQIQTLHEAASQSVGRPIDEVRKIDSRPESFASRIGWLETTYTLDNGNWVYVSPERPQCAIHFEVNPQGIVIAYQSVGEGCRNQ